jgi:PAS domain S-box-containing protein
MINTSHPGTTPHDTETASDLDSATGQAGTIGDWAASLAKLLRVAYREVDTDRERAKAAIAKASSLLRLQIERSSLGPARSPLHLEHDMNVRPRVGEALRASDERWRTVFENASVGIALTDPGGHFVMANPAYQRMLGYSETELQCLSLADITDHVSAKATTAPGAEGQTGGVRLEIRCRRKDGREVWAEVRTFAIPSAGRLLCLIAIDITRRKQAEEALGDAQAGLADVARLATLGELAASIAHEINPPIGAIATQATACLRWPERDKPDLDKAREDLVRVEREARRAREVVRQPASPTMKRIPN